MLIPVVLKFSTKFLCSADCNFRYYRLKTFRTNYLSAFVVSCCATYHHMGRVEHVLNWAVSLSLFCPPGLLIWIFMSPNDLSKYLPLRIAFPHATYCYMRLHYMLTRWQSYSCPLLFLSKQHITPSQLNKTSLNINQSKNM